MMINLDNKNNMGRVIPVSDIVLLPGMYHTLKFNKFSETQIESLSDEDIVNIALPLKQNFGQSKLKEEDFHRVGVTFQVNAIEKQKRDIKQKLKY